MDIIAGDDCFCVKSGENAPGRAVGMPSRDIRFRHNIARECSNPHSGGQADAGGAFKIGTEMSGGVFNVLFEDSAVGYAGMALKVSTPVPRGTHTRKQTQPSFPLACFRTHRALQDWPQIIVNRWLETLTK
jgi:polygalacturonase